MAFDAFLKIEGLPGESTDSKHKEWIEVLSFTLGVTQPQSGSQSTAGSLTAERAQFTDLTITKALDKASPKLNLHCANGEHFPSVTLELCRAGGDKQPYMQYKFTNVSVSSVHVGGSGKGEQLPVEEISLNYGQIEWSYTKLGMDGKPSGNVATKWSLKDNA